MTLTRMGVARTRAPQCYSIIRTVSGAPAIRSLLWEDRVSLLGGVVMPVPTVVHRETTIDRRRHP